jgi:Lrp/AsnC family transcriptional regulator, leucine-responsive regulatory protein
MSEIDPIDARILRELARDSAQANLTLAAKVGLSPSACLRRVRALEGRGAIRGYRAQLDPGTTGRAFVAYVAVGLSDHARAAHRRFEQAMAAAPEVTECHNVTGTYEYLLRVETADLATYKHFHSDVLGMVPGVRSITSHVVMDSPKDDRG